MLSQMGMYMAFNIFLSLFSEIDGISNLIVMVKSMFIFVDIIFINLRLLFPTY